MTAMNAGPGNDLLSPVRKLTPLGRRARVAAHARTGGFGGLGPGLTLEFVASCV